MKARQTLSYCIRPSFYRFVFIFSEDMKVNPKRFWSNVNATLPPFQNTGFSWVFSPSDILSAFCSHFESLLFFIRLSFYSQSAFCYIAYCLQRLKLSCCLFFVRLWYRKEVFCGRKRKSQVGKTGRVKEHNLELSKRVHKSSRKFTKVYLLKSSFYNIEASLICLHF